MNPDIHDVLAAAFRTHSVVRRIHDVPPHEVYEVAVDGQRAVLKRDTGPTGNAGVEGRVTAFVGEKTSVPVPDVLAVGTDYYVAAWHPDAPEPGTPRVADETWARAAGRGLATLHDETDPLLDEYGAFRAGDEVRGIDIAGHSDWHAAALAYVRERRSTLAEYGHADVADAVVDYLTEHPDRLRDADGPVCCHGWATPEHVGVVDGGVACVLDFEHAMAAPGEFDYWRTVLPTFGPDTEDALRSFRAGYESVRSLPADFDRRKPVYVTLNEVYYLESLHVQDQHGPAETADRAEWLRSNVLERLGRRL